MPKAYIRAEMKKAVERGFMTREEEIDDSFNRITFTTSIEEAACDADLVIEACVWKKWI